MRVSFILSALGAITTSSALPWNTTAAISNITGDVQPYKTPSDHHQIPVAMTKCLGFTFSKQNYLGAKENMISWSEEKEGVYPGAYHAESYPDSMFGVTWYLCNCKNIHVDKAPRWELDEVQRILEEKCGKWQSGWVWSKKWEKGYNVVPTDWFRYQLEDHKDICPPHCFNPF
ncbi:hypothetical protein F4801DRAFT_585703 [Xylaria longipes]|nr:hypothetical protein F4801DRAFT_585703 [Xylaria longipes]RYC63279.1 hypothetical protein CHU98_g2913 [Xylaria longipes]